MFTKKLQDSLFVFKTTGTASLMKVAGIMRKGCVLYILSILLSFLMTGCDADSRKMICAPAGVWSVERNARFLNSYDLSSIGDPPTSVIEKIEQDFNTVVDEGIECKIKKLEKWKVYTSSPEDKPLSGWVVQLIYYCSSTNNECIDKYGRGDLLRAIVYKRNNPFIEDLVIASSFDWVLFQNGEISAWAGYHTFIAKKPYFLSANGKHSIELVVEEADDFSDWRRRIYDDNTFGLAFYMRALLSQLTINSNSRTDLAPKYRLYSKLQSIETPTLGTKIPATVNTFHQLIETKTGKVIWEREIIVTKVFPMVFMNANIRGAHAMSMAMASIADKVVNEVNTIINERE